MERATFRDERSSRQGPLTLWPCLSVRYAKHNPISMGSASSWEVVLSSPISLFPESGEKCFDTQILEFLGNRLKSKRGGASPPRPPAT